MSGKQIVNNDTHLKETLMKQDTFEVIMKPVK